jgi:glycosyltransferase involved in cell wall biosynthesis
LSIKKKVMHLIATNFYGGPEKQIIEHLKRLNEDRYTALLVSYIDAGAPNEILQKAEQSGIKSYGIPMANAIDIRALFKLIKIIRKEDIDLLCVHGYKSTIMGWYVGKMFKLPVLAFSRGYTTEDRKVAFYEWLDRKFLGRIDGVISVSKGQQQKLHSLGVYAKREWVVHNAVEIPDDSTFKHNQLLRQDIYSRLGITAHHKMVVTAGRLSQEKGHRYLIDAIAKLGNKINGISFVFCGAGPEETSLKDQARKLGVNDRCYFVGFRRDISEIFRVMDLFVLPSLTEGLPNVILEAFAYHKPVISTSVGGVPELVKHDINGILLNACDVTALSNAMEKCLQSDKLLHDMGEAGFRTVSKDFTFTLQTGRLESIYEGLIS